MTSSVSVSEFEQPNLHLYTTICEVLHRYDDRTCFVRLIYRIELIFGVFQPSIGSQTGREKLWSKLQQSGRKGQFEIRKHKP